MLWACVLLPHLALDGVLRRRANHDPLVLVDGAVNARSIVAVNTSAREAGLRVGQRLIAKRVMSNNFAFGGMSASLITSLPE